MGFFFCARTRFLLIYLVIIGRNCLLLGRGQKFSISKLSYAFEQTGESANMYVCYVYKLLFNTIVCVFWITQTFLKKF